MVFQPPATSVYSYVILIVILRSLLDIVIKDVRLGSSFATATMDGQSQKRAATHLVPSLHGCHGNHWNMDVHLLCKKKRKTPKTFGCWKDPFSTEQLALLEEGSHQIQTSAPNLSWETHFSP